MRGQSWDRQRNRRTRFWRGVANPAREHRSGICSRKPRRAEPAGGAALSCWWALSGVVFVRGPTQCLFLLSIVRRKRNDSVPVSIMCARSVIRSNRALQSLGFGNTVVHSENGRFNAESIFMRTPHSMERPRRHFAVFLLRILGAAFNISISLSVAFSFRELKDCTVITGPARLRPRARK